MRRKSIVVIGVFAAIALSVLVVRYYSKSVLPIDTLVWVKVASVQQQDLALEAKAIGTLVAARNVQITPEINGHVEKILFQDGTFVKQGTPLIQLDNQTARAGLVSAKAGLAYAEADYKRKQWLGKQGAIAQQAIEQAEADLKEKKAGALEKEIAHEKTLLKAPFDGVVGKCKVNPGDYVTVGQSVVALTDIQHLRVEYSVSEKFLSQLKQGQAITLMTSAYPNTPFVGKVAFISPTINSEERTIALYAEVENLGGALKPGMFINLTQSLGAQHRVLVVPARTLVPAMGGEQVYKIVNGKAQAVSVVVGSRAGDWVQVVEGLAAGDMVVTDGQLKLKDGVPVQITTR